MLRPAYGRNHLYGATTLRTTMLDKQYEEMRSEVLPMLAKARYFSIVTDGWESQSRQHLINIIIHTPNNHPIYYKSINTTSESLNSEKLAEILCSVAEEIGKARWLSVVTDNASVNLAAAKIIEKTLPSVFMVGCDSHSYNLLIKDICCMKNSPVIHDLIERANLIVTFIVSHRDLRVPFEEVRQRFGITSGLKQKCDTRFATNFLVMESLSNNRNTLNELVFKYKEVWAVIRSEQKNRVQEAIKDPTFWESIDVLLGILKPIADLINQSESDNIYVESTYKNWMELKNKLEHVKLHELIERKVLLELVHYRWNFIHVPVHAFAYILNPATASKAMCKGFCPIRRKKFDDYRDTIKQLKEHFRDFYNDKVLEEQAYSEYEEFCQKSDEDTTKNPRAYWSTFGVRDFPVLAKVALRIFQVQTSAASAERCWSILGFIETKSRNNLNTGTLDKLAFLKINAALKDNKLDPVQQEDFF